MLALELKCRFTGIERTVTRRQRQHMECALFRMLLHGRAGAALGRCAAEQDKVRRSFQNVVAQKEAETTLLSKKYLELQEAVQAQKQRELELQQKLRQAEHMAQQMEVEVAAQRRQGDTRNSLKVIDQRVTHTHSNTHITPFRSKPSSRTTRTYRSASSARRTRCRPSSAR